MIRDNNDAHCELVNDDPVVVVVVVANNDDDDDEENDCDTNASTDLY